MDITKLLFSFEGRISRQPYWLFVLAMIIIILFPAFVIFGIETEAADNYVTIMSIIVLWPSLAVQAKRWHDRNKSGFWILINLLPIIGPIWATIENGFLPGTEGENNFGDNPIEVESGVVNET